MSPSPITQAVSPSATSARRTPCMAMAPTVANAACSAATPSGTGTHKFVGTQFTSACRANSFPAAATTCPTTHLDHDSAQRVAKWGIAVQPVHRLLIRGEGALLGHRVEQLADLIWPGACLADQRHLRLADLHHLGACRDQREQRPDQDATRLACGHRDVEDVEVTGLVVLSYLLHATLSCTYQLAKCAAFTVARPPQPRRRDTTAPSRAAATTASTGLGARCADR